MKPFLLIISISLVLLFSGCSKNKPVKVDSYPNWYINPPVNNENYLYGEGLGVTKDEAKQNALHNLSSRLIVKVSSSIQTNTNSYSNGVVGSYNKSIQKDVKTEIEKIQLSNAKTLKTKYVNSEFVTLIQIDKNELYLNYLNNFKQLDTQIIQQYTQNKSKPILEKLITINNLKSKIQKNTTNSAILKALDSSFIPPNYSNILNEESILKSNPIFITSNTPNKPFANQLSNLLNKNGYQTNTNKNNEIKIDIKNNIQNSKARGWFITKTTTTLKVFSKDKLISTNIIDSVGRSSSSKELSLQSSANDFNTKINKLGLEKILFSK